MTSFAELGLDADLLKSLDSLGFSTPTPVQEEVIPCLLKLKDDLVGLSQTGTGKTAAYGLPLIQLLDRAQMKTQTLILCPTRELCVQVTKDLHTFSRYLAGVKIVAVYGGASIVTQSRQLQQGAQIIVATPGRLLAFINEKKVDLRAIRAVVLDEADEMLQMGFQEDLNAILAVTPATKKTILFSATMPREVVTIANRYMKNPVEVTIGERNQGIENVHHIYYLTAEKNRYQTLKRIADSNPDIYAIIFCRTRQETREIAEKLIEDGYNADALHGELSQGQRDAVMHKFRRRNLQLLVATDVAARGLDVKDLSHVINYNLPDDASSYTHRSGRTGRAGKEGVSIAIIQPREKYKLNQIERRLKRRFEQGRIPTGQEICQLRMLHYLDKLKKREIDTTHIEPFLPAIFENLIPLEREELIKRFVLAEFAPILRSYRNAPDLNIREREVKSRHERSERRSSDKRYTTATKGREQFTRFHLNVGKRDGVNPGRLIGEINDATADGRRVQVGRIEILKNCSLLEADSRSEAEILHAFSNLMINGRRVVARVGGENEKITSRPARPAWKKRKQDRKRK
ncbi:MAG TPA: DEAD/DEAH box helicase [Proteobacteria bacterium]|nr:DEAD/DEAH box helicase [Pseudomonadota bacterium]